MIRYFKSNQNYVEDLKICKTEAEGKSYPCLPNESWKWLEINSDEFAKLERSIMKNEFVFCQRCGAKLKTIEGGEYNVIWLEYDQRTGTYTNKEVPSEFSQGGFPFGKDCAKIVLAENKAAEENAHLMLAPRVAEVVHTIPSLESLDTSQEEIRKENRMSENYCKNCGQYKSSFREHECPPQWQAVRPEYGDPEDESTFYEAFGHDAEAAALDIAERKFSDWEYPREVEIWVRQNPFDEWQKFEISVESVPSFSAHQV